MSQHRRDLILACLTLFVFFIPLIIMTITHFPGPVMQYATFSGGHKANSIRLAAKYIAFYWGGWTISALAVTLAACGGGDNGTDSGATSGDSGSGDAYSGLSGSIAGAGASSMENAQNAWMAEFNNVSGVNVSYDPVGSGGGREQFIAGTTLFAGSDSAL